LGGRGSAVRLRHIGSGRYLTLNNVLCKRLFAEILRDEEGLETVRWLRSGPVLCADGMMCGRAGRS